MQRVEILKEIENHRDVMDFIDSQDKISVFQSKYFLDLYERIRGLEGMLLICRSDKRVTGILLVQIQNYFGSAVKSFSSRALIIGGPVGDNASGGKLINEFIDKIKGKAVYTQVRCLFQNKDADRLFGESGYQRIDHLNYIIDLTKGEEECWKKLHSKRRNEVRKAVKEGITFSEINYSTETKDAYAVLKNIYGRARLPLPEMNYFDEAIRLMTGNGVLRIFGGYFEEKLIGVMYVLCYNGIVYDWYAGSYDEYLKKCPNDLITWEVIRWSINNGFKTFDFGGAGSPGKEYGVRDFKKKFGGEELNTGRYEIIHRPAIMRISKTGFKFWQKLQKNK